MKNVYVIQINHGIDNFENLGIFTTYKKAEKFIDQIGYKNRLDIKNKLRDIQIIEVELNRAVGF